MNKSDLTWELNNSPMVYNISDKLLKLIAEKFKINEEELYGDFYINIKKIISEGIPTNKELMIVLKKELETLNKAINELKV